MHIAICDDDVEFTKSIEALVISFFRKKKIIVPEISIYYSGEELLQYTQPIDILFLDIEFEGLSGIFVGRELKKRYPGILIFIITSYMEYLDDAMRFHVFRYLSKPIEPERLFRNLKDAITVYQNTTSEIAIETKEGITRCAISNIICVEAQNRNVLVYTQNGLYHSVKNMQYWAEQLPRSCFFQTHRSFIVNMKYVTDFDHSVVHLKNFPTNAYLTRRKYSAFKDAFLIYLENQ